MDLVARASVIFLFLGWVAGQAYVPYVYVPPSCEPLSPCKCRYSWGRGFDLTNSTVAPLNNAQGSSNSSVVYYFNPCPPVAGTNNSCPENAAFCKSVGGKFEILGLHANATFGKLPVEKNATTGKPLPTVYTTQYLYTDENNVTHTTTVALKCSYSAVDSIIEKDPKQPGMFILSSKGACMTAVPLPVEDGISAGAAFLAVFFSLVAVYLIGGMAVMKYIKGAQGVEIIPNYSFWTGLPSLIRDGFLFAASGCRGDVAYDRI